MGSKENPLSFASLRLVDLRNGQRQYLSTMKQLIDARPKTLDPASRFALRGHIARPGQPCLRHSMRAAMWFLLPSNGVFRRSSTSLQYYLTGVLSYEGVMLPYLPWNAALTGSPTQHPPHPEITAKRIIRLCLNLASYPAR